MQNVQAFQYIIRNRKNRLNTEFTTLPTYDHVRVVFKWVSKVITWLRSLRLVIGFKDSRQIFNQWKAKPLAPCTRHFSCALSELQVIAMNCDWFVALFAHAVIGRSNCFGFGFSTVIWKPLYQITHLCFYVGCIFYGNLFFVGSRNQYVALSLQKIFFSHLKHEIENQRGYCLHQVNSKLSRLHFQHPTGTSYSNFLKIIALCCGSKLP